MIRTSASLLFVLVTATSCATLPGNGGGAMAPVVARTPIVLDPAPAPALAPPVVTPAVMPTASSSPPPARRKVLTEGQLTLWNDPDFHRRFTESYLAETEIEPSVTINEREQLEKVLDYISSEEIDRAIRVLEKNGGEAASAVFDFTLANIHFQRDDLGLAAASYEVAVEKYPKFRRAWKNLGLIRVREGNWPAAARCLTKVIELGGSDAVTFGLLGFVYSNVENYLSAESAYRMATLLDPATMDWKMGLARCLFKEERFAAAAALCGTFIAEDPDRADMWLLQANAYIGLEQPLRAAENFELVDRLGKSTADSLNTLGDIYTNQELFDLAVDCYVRALAKRPERGAARAVRAAQILTARGALSETERLVSEIEALLGPQLASEDGHGLLKIRARLAVASGAGEEEARILREIVELDPLDGEALILLGQHAERAEDPEQAIFYFERAANLEEFEADAKVRHAQLLVRQSRYSEALPLLRRAQQIKPRENIRQYLEQVERIAGAR